MLGVCMAYRPAPGESVPIETDVGKFIRRETGNDSFFTYRAHDGRWVVGKRLGNGMILDAAEAGNGEYPEITEGTVPSLKSMLTAGEASRGLLGDVQKQIAARAVTDRKDRMEQNDEYDEYMGKVRAKVRGINRDAGMFKRPTRLQ